MNRNEWESAAPRVISLHKAAAIAWVYAPCSALAGTASLAFHRSPAVILMAAALPLLPYLMMTLTFAISYLRVIIFVVDEAKRAHDSKQESRTGDLHPMLEASTNSAVAFLTLTPMKAASSLRCREATELWRT